MRLSLLLITVLVLLSPVLALAQQQYQVFKSDKNEIFDLPYTASNHDKDNPLVYTFDSPKTANWILAITNNQTYVPSNDSKTIVRIQEPAASEKYIEIAMFGGESMTYWVAVNTPDQGYARLYLSPAGQPGWSNENPISISHDTAQGLTVTDGKRVVVDRLDLSGFAVGSIAVFGNDNNEKTSPNTTSGDINFEIQYGSFSQSPLFLVPAAVMAGVGGLVIGLLMFKKRKPE
jgi:hypothetical protein